MTFHYPLQWPPGWPKSDNTIGGNFKVDFDQAVKEVAYELELLGVESAYISTDYELRLDGRPRRDREPRTQSAALYFDRNGKQLCIPCDRFWSVRDNIRAIGLTLKAVRQMERYGTSQMVEAALAGFTALPAGEAANSPIYMQPSQPWYEVLGVQPDADKDVVRAVYKAKALKVHPDKEGGSAAEFQRLTNAYEEGMKQ